MKFTAINGTVVATTPDAVMIAIPAKKERLWVPRSVCEGGYSLQRGSTNVVVRADWYKRVLTARRFAERRIAETLKNQKRDSQ